MIAAALLPAAAPVEPLPLWVSIPGGLAPAVAATVAVLVALAGYRRFVKGRTLKPRLTLELTARVASLKGHTALDVHVTVRNDGQTAISLDAKYSQLLHVFIADDAVWNDAVTSDDGVVLWYDGHAAHRTVDVLLDAGLLTFEVPPFRALANSSEGSDTGGPGSERDQGTRSGLMTADGYILEPGERETHALLVPVSKAAAYLLRLSIHGCSHAGPMSRLGYAHRRCMTAQGPDLWQTTTLAYTSKVEGKAQ